ncbi:hypothetical protein BC830DRAFT_1118584 [Chytriomyces sp. MP71]|nr:hypothetical protein BC830DRAFT_1118584 [Chytriomyces sp. MP71]
MRSTLLVSIFLLFIGLDGHSAAAAVSNATSLGASTNVSPAPSRASTPTTQVTPPSKQGNASNSTAAIVAQYQESLPKQFGNATKCIVGCSNGNPSNTTVTINTVRSLCLVGAQTLTQAAMSPLVACITKTCPSELLVLTQMESNATVKVAANQTCFQLFPDLLSNGNTGPASGTSVSPAVNTGSAASSVKPTASTTTSAAFKTVHLVASFVVSLVFLMTI